MEQSSENVLPLCDALQRLGRHRLSRGGRRGQGGARLQLSACQPGMRGRVARRVSPRSSVRVTPPALCVMHMPGREAGCRGHGPPAPPAGKGRSAGSAPPHTDDREVRGALERGGVKPVEPLRKHSLACYPSSRKGRGPRLPTGTTRGLIIYGLNTKRHSRTHAAEARTSMGLYVYALVKHTNTHTHTSEPQRSLPSPPTSG